MGAVWNDIFVKTMVWNDNKMASLLGEFPKVIPYYPLSSVHFQIGIGSPKRHLFDWQFCVGLPQTICKQWAKGFCKILNFWPLHSVRQNVAGFRRGLFTCFLGHTPLLPAFWATPPCNSYKEPMIALLTAIWMSTVVFNNRGCQNGWWLKRQR